MNLNFIWYILLIIGYISIFTPPCYNAAQSAKLSPKDFSLQVSLPVTLGLILVLIGYTGLLYNYNDEDFFNVLIAFTAGGGVLVSILAA